MRRNELEEISDEFFDRLSEPGKLRWKVEWEDAIYSEEFRDYPFLLTNSEKLAPISEVVDKEVPFNGFVSMEGVKLDLEKINLQGSKRSSSKLKGESAYLSEGEIKYLQFHEKTKVSEIKTAFFINKNFYTQRIYSNAKGEDFSLFYFANYSCCHGSGYTLGFSQYSPDFFNIYVRREGKAFPLAKFEIKTKLPFAQEILNDPQIFTNFERFQSLMKDKKCMLFSAISDGKIVNEGGSVEANVPQLKLSKALKLL